MLLAQLVPRVTVLLALKVQLEQKVLRVRPDLRVQPEQLDHKALRASKVQVVLQVRPALHGTLVPELLAHLLLQLFSLVVV